MAKTIFFDLDGTITESGMGITRSVAHALGKRGIEETDQKKLDRFVGPPLLDSFMGFYGLTAQEARAAVEDYREYYAVRGIFENRVYDGVGEMLKTLVDAGKICVLATSKPEPYAIQILEHFGLSPYFTHVCGSTMDETRTGKAEVIAYAMEVSGCSDPIMVGDREHDILGAKAHGLRSVGVLYGYGSREELEKAGADYMAATAKEAAEILLRI